VSLPFTLPRPRQRIRWLSRRHLLLGRSFHAGHPVDTYSTVGEHKHGYTVPATRFTQI